MLVHRARRLLLALVVLGCSLSIGHAQTKKGPTPDELDRLLAPIALYPDQLLAQMLVCATKPGDVVALNGWLTTTTRLKGTELQDAAVAAGFEPSFVALALFPQTIKMMADQLDSTTRIGQAFTTNRSDVFASIQRLRAKAKESGNLKTTSQQEVETRTTSAGEQVIVIEPANPQVVYVPQYNPTVVYTQPASTTVVVQESSSSADAAAAAPPWTIATTTARTGGMAARTCTTTRGTTTTMPAKTRAKTGATTARTWPTSGATAWRTLRISGPTDRRTARRIARKIEARRRRTGRRRPAPRPGLRTPNREVTAAAPAGRRPRSEAVPARMRSRATPAGNRRRPRARAGRAAEAAPVAAAAADGGDRGFEAWNGHNAKASDGSVRRSGGASGCRVMRRTTTSAATGTANLLHS
jgi:hypothetical protein